MPDLKLIKNPGYVFDLLFLLHYNYNADEYAERFDRTKEEMDYFAEQVKLFDPAPDDLYVFFKWVNGKNCFLTTYYFHCYSNILTTEYDLAFLQKAISDYDTFIKNMINYYFEELDDGEVNKSIESKQYLFDIVKKSNYDDKLKLKLYEFFMDPEPYIRTLQYELMAKEVQLSSYYEKNYSKILDVYNEMNYDLLCKRLEFFDHFKDERVNRNNMYVSFCLLNKRLLYFSYHSHATLCLFGVDYHSCIEQFKNKSIDLMPELFGAALSDVNRVKMLDIILEKGECTCKELEETLGLSASTTYHHLSTLVKCDVLYTKNLKKSVYYRIRPGYFEAAIEYFKKFCQCDKNKE